MSDALVVRLLQKYMPRGRPASGEFIAPCPFHKGGRERRPSFGLNLQTGLSFCHTCHQGWSFRTLLFDLGLGPRRVDHEMAKVPPEFSSPARRRCTFKGELEFTAGDVLPETLLAPYRKRCPSRLLRAGFDRDTLRHFEVGYDRGEERVIYPVRNHRGSLINIIGRVHEHRRGEGQPKHFPLMREIRGFLDDRQWKPGPKRYLWNLHRIYPTAFHHGIDQVIVVEGFKQLMWVWQAGYKNVVALLGSHVSRAQRSLLHMLGCDLLLFLDNDPAGREGTLEIAKRMIGIQMVRVCEYPVDERQQPDGLDEEQIRDCIENPVDLRTWRKACGV